MISLGQWAPRYSRETAVKRISELKITMTPSRSHRFRIPITEKTRSRPINSSAWLKQKLQWGRVGVISEPGRVAGAQVRDQWIRSPVAPIHSTRDRLSEQVQLRSPYINEELYLDSLKMALPFPACFLPHR